MCEPTTIVMLTTLAVSAIGAAMQNSASNSAIEAQSEAQNRNTAEGYRVAQENSRQAEAAAFEKRTDRARQATRQLAMARVGAAEGAGSLAANAINITAAEADDMSRIDATLSNQKSAARGQIAALQTQSADAINIAKAQGNASQVQAQTQIAQALVGTGASYFRRQTQLDLAKQRRTTLDSSTD